MTERKRGVRPRKNHDRELAVTAEAGLLEFLLGALSGRSRNHVKSLLTHREVSVDGMVVTQYDHLLRPGQIVRISRAVRREESPADALEILYEDDELIVINKPAGLLSIATDKERVMTAYFLLTDYVRRDGPENRIYAVHRLDRDTSGVLMAAKNPEIQKALQDGWAELVTERSYAAVIEGKLDAKSGRVHSWLRETKTQLVYSSHTPGDGLEAITDYRVVREGNGYSLLAIRLLTGRKNQIRVHMKDLGHPVAGDKKYGAATNPAARLCLHADALELVHPFTHEVMRFEARIPRRLLSLLKEPSGRG